ncbi:RES family NAD+ phosphorylase [Mycolicibacterium sp. HS_4_1]
MAPIVASSNLYDGLPPQEKLLSRRLLKEFTNLQSSCAHSLSDRPNFLQHSSNAILATRNLFQIVASSIEPAVDTLDWKFVVLATRTCDRTLAMLGAAHAVFAVDNSDYFPYTAVLHICVQSFEKFVRAVSDRSVRSGGSLELYGSGPLAEIIRHGAHIPKSLYEAIITSDFGRRQIISGIVSDSLDLITDLQYAADVSPISGLAPANNWTSAIPGLTPEARSGWRCGPLFLIDDFASFLSVAVADVQRMVANDEVIRFPWWDGRDLFPAIQINPATGTLYPKVAELLDALEPNFYTMIGLSMWLGLTDSASGDQHAEWLENKAKFQDLKDKLAEIGVLAPNKYRYGTPRLPSLTALQSALNRGYYGSRAGSEGSFLSRRTGAPTTDHTDPMYRITSRVHGPFFFAQRPGRKGTGGRFDIVPGKADGTMYLAETVEGAISEVYARILVLDIQALTTRLLWELRNSQELVKLLDLTDPECGKELGGVPTTTFTTMNRSVTQKLSTDARTAGYGGLIHDLKTTTESNGIAIFGPAGPTYPEDANLGSWSCKVRMMSESEEFWEWVRTRNEYDADNMHIILSQLPFERLLPP